MTTARCPSCQAEFEVPPGSEAFLIACPKCKAEVKVEADSAPLAGTGSSTGGAPLGGPHPAPTPGGAPAEAERPQKRPTVASAIGSFAAPAGSADAAGAGAGADGPPDVETFGQYELISRMHSSDVAVTYRARRTSESRIVVLKVLVPGKTVTREEIACVAERARRARSLDHPGVGKVIEVSKAEGTDYIAAEFVEGKPLTTVIEGGGNSVGESVELVGTFAEALAHAHAENVVHGNLKPSNIIVDNHGKPKVTDFGMAREFWRIPTDQLKYATADRIPLPYYMAPEQIRGGEPSPQSDVYSIGAVLYHMLARRVPYAGRKLAEVVLAIDRGDAPPPSAANFRVPVSVDAIVTKCLQKEPGDRFANAGELAAEIDHFLRGQKVKAMAPGPARRLARSLRSRAGVVAAIVVAAALSAGGAYYAARSGRIPAIGGADAAARARVAGALALGEQGLWLEAAKELNAVETLGDISPGTRAQALTALGVSHMRSGRPKDAASAFRRAIALRPGDADAHYLLGVALWHGGADPSEVAREIGESLRLDPARGDSARYQYEYGRACRRAALVENARSAFERVRAIDPRYRAAMVKSHLAALDAPDEDAGAER